MANNAFALDKWVKAESKHFTVYANISDKDAIAYTKRLEQFRYILGAFYNTNGKDDAIKNKFTIYLMKDQKSLKVVMPSANEFLRGFVRPCTMGTNGYAVYEGDKIRDTKNIRNQAENSSLNVIFHEFTHIFMFQNSTFYYPEWFVEGYAEFYGPTQISGDQAIIGLAESGRYYTLINQDRAISYKDVLKLRSEIKKDPEKYNSFYAQSWLLTHYMISDPVRKKKLVQYFEETSNGAEEIEAFERIIGIKVKDLSKILMKYLDNDLKATIYRLSQMPNPEIKISELPKSADKLLLMNAAATSCSGYENDETLYKLIEQEVKKYPGDKYADMVMANANIYIGHEEKAVDFYKKYTAENPNDAKGFFNLGLTYYLMAKHDKFLPKETYASQIKLARSMFGKSYLLDASDAPNLYYFSLTASNNSLKPDVSSYNAAYEAFLSSPTMIDYAFNAMQMQLRSEDLEDAKSTMEIIISNPHIDESLKTNLKNAINAIKEKKPIEKIFEALSATNLPKVE